MKRALDQAFTKLATALFAKHPEVPHEWREVKGGLGGSYVDLVCGPGSPNEVWASLREWQIAVGVANGDHDDFEDFGRGLSEDAIAAEALERVVQLLRQRGHLAPETEG